MSFRKVVIAEPMGPSGGYLRSAVQDSVVRGEAPYIAHTVALSAMDVANPTNLRYVMASVGVWMQDAEALVAYTDLGVDDSEMRLLINFAERFMLPIESRSLPDWQGVSVRNGSGFDPSSVLT